MTLADDLARAVLEPALPELRPYLVDGERRQQRVIEVPPQDRTLLCRRSIDDRSRRCPGRRPEQIHDQKCCAGTSGTSNLAPKRQRIGEMMEQAVRDACIETLIAERQRRHSCRDHAYPPIEARGVPGGA